MTARAESMTEALDAAMTTLSLGGIVVHPTETVYGIGCAVQGPGMERLRSAKGRGRGGFVVLIPAAGDAPPTLGSVGRRLAEAFWPGPLTLVCEDPDHAFPDEVKAGDGSVALRVCGHPLTQDLVRRFGGPMTSTSANLPGEAPAAALPDAMAACERMGLTASGLDGGLLPGGLPSTLVDVRGEGWAVIRHGAIPIEELQRVAGDPRGQGGPR